MLQQFKERELILVGKAKDVKLALNSIKNTSKQNETLQQYLLQRPQVIFNLHIE